MTAVGVIGLGTIGMPVAKSFARGGHDVRGFDVAAGDAARRELALCGGRTVSDLGDLVRESDVVVTVLPHSDAVEAVMRSTAVMDNLRSESIWVEMSSGYPADTRRLAQMLKDERSVELVDAPICNGGVPGAERGELTLCLGGDGSAIEQVQPTLEAVATKILVVGPVGAGHMVKLLSNYVALGVGSLMTEVIGLGEANGIPAEQLTGWLDDCVASKFVGLDHIRQALLAEHADGPASFRVELARKDLRYVCAQAAMAAVPTPMAEGAHAHYLTAERTGYAASESTYGPLLAMRRLLGAG